MRLEKLAKSDLVFLVEYMMQKDQALRIRIKDMLTEDITNEGIDQLFDRICVRYQMAESAALAKELAQIFGYILQNHLAEGYTMKAVSASIQVYRRTSELFKAAPADEEVSKLFDELLALIREGKKQLVKWSPELLEHPIIADEIEEELQQFADDHDRQQVQQVWEGA